MASRLPADDDLAGGYAAMATDGARNAEAESSLGSRLGGAVGDTGCSSDQNASDDDCSIDAVVPSEADGCR
jgi:hypothetical protein